MSKQLFKALLENDFFCTYGDQVQEEMFPRELQPVFRTIMYAMDKYKTTLTLHEVRDLHYSLNPMLTDSNKAVLDEIFNTLESLPPYNPEIAEEIIQKAYESEICRQIIEHTLKLESGTSNDWEKLEVLKGMVTASRDANSLTTSRYDVVDLDNIDNVIIDRGLSHGDWQFNILNVQEKTTGLHRGSFTIVAARPEAGKTAFHVSLSCAPGGFIHQGASVHVWRNEEKYDMLAKRVVSAILQTPMDQISNLQDQFAFVREDILGSYAILKDDVTLNKSLLDIDKYLAYNKSIGKEVDILIIDQLDHIRVGSSPARNDVSLLDQLYAETRELAIKYNIAIIGFTQAGAEADNKLHFGYSELYGSKTGKAANADTIFCIGHQRPLNGFEDTGIRVITYAKNKFGGPQSATTCVLKHNISTFTE